jgi:hypothetical protein
MREFDRIDAEVFLFGFCTGCALCAVVIFAVVLL